MEVSGMVLNPSQNRRPVSLHRIGRCQNCGDCCILYIDGQFKRCVWYTLYSEQHCTIYETRPQVCRDFPRGPADQLDKPLCGYSFVDDQGRCVDGYQDLRTQFRAINVLNKMRIEELKTKHAKRTKSSRILHP